MNRFLALLFIALVTFIIVLLATNPDWIGEIWLYVIGLFGLIAKIFKSAAAKFTDVFKEIAAKKEEAKKEASQPTYRANERTEAGCNFPQNPHQR